MLGGRGMFAWMTVAGIAAAILVNCAFDVMRVQGTAMEPSIADGNLLVINKAAYLYREPRAGDVIVFNCNVYSEDQEGSDLVRRVAAVEGDRVRITDGKLYVNDRIYGTYEDSSIYLEPMDEITVGTNRIFVLADSETAVIDSRNQAVGQLRIDEISGKVCFE